MIGGIAGLAIIAALLWWFFRRRAKRDEFDGDFDPDRVTRQTGTGDLDLDDGADTRVDPFTTGAAAGVRGPTFPEPDMSQHAGYSAGYGGPGGYAPSNLASSMRTSSPPQSAYDPHNYGFAGVMPSQYVGGQYGQSPYAPGPHGPSPSPPTTSAGSSGSPGELPNPHSASGASSQGRSAKERERLRLANAVPEDEEAGPVVQHRDGGRVNSEIPPSYDSIPRDQ